MALEKTPQGQRQEGAVYPYLRPDTGLVTQGSGNQT
jgi:hypothetical protein